jgi:hypothetical protein
VARPTRYPRASAPLASPHPPAQPRSSVASRPLQSHRPRCPRQQTRSSCCGVLGALFGPWRSTAPRRQAEGTGGPGRHYPGVRPAGSGHAPGTQHSSHITQCPRQQHKIFYCGHLHALYAEKVSAKTDHGGRTGRGAAGDGRGRARAGHCSHASRINHCRNNRLGSAVPRASRAGACRAADCRAAGLPGRGPAVPRACRAAGLPGRGPAGPRACRAAACRAAGLPCRGPAGLGAAGLRIAVPRACRAGDCRACGLPREASAPLQRPGHGALRRAIGGRVGGDEVGRGGPGLRPRSVAATLNE